MNVFITGITGTLGKRVAELCLRKGYKVHGITRDEFKLKELKKEMPELKLYICDVTSLTSLDYIISRLNCIDVFYHFAALKHVDLCEKAIFQCLDTNIKATKNIATLQAVHGIRKVVFTSTDKAVLPINIYGQCKAISEKIILNSNSDNVVCRYGNVLNSRGSVFKTFRDQIFKDNVVTLTDDRMTRFFITIESAAKFVFSLSENKGGIHIPWKQMKACQIKDLAIGIRNAMYNEGIVKSGGDPVFKYIGLRPGEKIHEDMGYMDGKLISSYFYERFTSAEILGLAKSELNFGLL